MITARCSDHPALVAAPNGRLSALVDQPSQIHSGVYWLSEIQHRARASDGVRYARLVLDDARGVIIALLWPEWLHQLGAVRCPGPVFVLGRAGGGAGDRCLHVERIRTLGTDEPATGASLLPRRMCPEAALPALDALIDFEAKLIGPLSGFLRDVLRDPEIGLPFIRCKASQHHHHAWPGGLLAHSVEMLPLADPLARAAMPAQPNAVELVGIVLLLHDVGKILTVGESVRPRWPDTAAGSPRHEVVGLQLLRPHLERLKWVDRESWQILDYCFRYMAAEPRKRGYAESLIVDVVRLLDQLSTARAMGKGVMPGRSYPR